MSAMTECVLFMLYVFVGGAHIFSYLAMCFFIMVNYIPSWCVYV